MAVKRKQTPVRKRISRTAPTPAVAGKPAKTAQRLFTDGAVGPAQWFTKKR